MERIEKIRPMDIEKESMRIIEAEMGDATGFSPEELPVLKRVIHTTADFDYVRNLKFSKDAVRLGRQALLDGAAIVTDTNMAKAGISKPATERLGCTLHCFMADTDVAQEAKARGITRAAVSVEKAARFFDGQPLIYAVGNAPTALIRLYELIQEDQLHPALIIGAPVGFVNILASKRMIMETDVPYIVADGRKGGSNVAAAICNALLYQLYDRNG